MNETLRAGLIAGVAGTAVQTGLTAIERRTGVRRAVSDPGVIAARLARRVLGWTLDRRERAVAGALLRSSYGAGLAVALAPLLARARHPVLAGAGIGALIWSFELVALPLSGATPPLRRWGRVELWANLLNASAYGVVVAGVLDRARRGER